MNFKNFGNEPSETTPPGVIPLARQSSVYSLTFDEFQRGGSIGKDFGSMNMDELLKNIWTVEESQQQIMGSTSANGIPGNYLQQQGSITLPHTLGQKTVDEIWKDSSEKTNFPPRQLTLGEVTLEEFLFRAGVVKLPEKTNNFDSLGDLNRPIINPPAGFEFQQMGTNVFESNNQSVIQTNNLNKPPQQIFPKAYANPIHVSNGTCIGDNGIGIIGSMDPITNGNLGMISMGTNGVAISTSSPNMESQSISPAPYVFTGLRGRRGNNAVEKVIERRHRRMIKNRESAARSRARKQAYTMELEAEIANLKEEYQELQKKQARIIEMQKNKIFETKNVQQGGKRRRLKRTQTGPW